MNQQPSAFSREEPIPGYHTTEMIGRGGFGEVWHAVAPGGVPKAIKMVFGDDPSRSESELRSLNRIKDVRHPLILSIDRIEVVNGTLVIVTELGDCNLKEFCMRYRGQGNAGIPQPELVKLLRDAAEALDFIYTEHSLQHLDVKPENFLVFGKHLKIADFGVVKHIYERSASLVHGLTPIYAPPELFEGKANRHSDQYSLAIVYQEMLTGQLPFDGLSPARLATQHLKEPPNLQSLPAAQQPVIARALSKDPHQRFESCVELVLELEKAIEKSAPSPTESKDAAPSSPPKPIPMPGFSEREKIPTSQKHPKPAPKPRADSSLDSLFKSIDQETQSLPPTILVGIGGTAANVLQQLRLRINERLGRLSAAPALKLLLIDSDVQQLNQINRDEDVWKEIETVASPLRKSEEYRAQDGYLKRWINRRWLYNIPRDQSTDGIRPLGRLALVSNFKRVFSSLEKALKECTSAESAQQTIEGLGVPFAPGKPRVILLTSLSGGTGSGMLFDVAYAIRGMLSQAGFRTDHVDAVLMHSTPRNKGRDKAIANAYATLQELGHYCQPGQYYPGDSRMQVEAFHGNNRTFRDLEFLHLGDNLEEQQWKDAADDVAEHLFSALLEKPDPPKNNSPNEEVAGKSVSIQQLGAANRQFLKDFSSQMCLEMLECWRGKELQERTTVSFTRPTTFLNKLNSPNMAKHRRLSEALNEKVAAFGLSVESLLEQTRHIMLQEVGKPPAKYIDALIQQALQVEPHPNATLADSALCLIEHILSLEDPDADDLNEQNTLFATLMTRSETFANKLSAELRDWLQNLVNDPNARVDGAQYAAEQAHGLIQDMLSLVARDKAHTREKLDGLRLAISTDQENLNQRGSRWNPFRSSRNSKLSSVLGEYGTTKMDAIYLAVVHKQLRTIEANLGVTIDQTQRLSHDLTRLSQKFETGKLTDSTQIGSQSFDQSVAWYVQGVRESLLGKRMQIIRNLEGVIQNTLAQAGYQLQKFLDHRVELSDILLAPMREHARDVVSRSVAEIHCEMIDAGESDPSPNTGAFQLSQLVQNLIAEHWPTDLSQREQSRISILVPQSADASRLSEQFQELGQAISVVNLVTNGITLVREVDEITLFDFCRSLTHGAEIYKDLASRLHSRDDVEWIELLEPQSEKPSNPPALNPGVNIGQTAVLDN